MNTKKELKETYKQMKPPMGVFQIKNRLNNKILVDSSTNMESKWNRHKTELRFGNHRNKQLQEDWNNIGEANFEYKVKSELKVIDGSNPNYPKELKILKGMVVEELNLDQEMLY
ncbi:MAG: GIY-YIG nuclease family protein [Saprospiraceae bacterium]|nr:GIY-YIG nuclease family protein [Saprospiraceae bacterium]